MTGDECRIGQGDNTGRIRVLQVCAVDETVGSLLLPLINRLSDEGFDVASCCSKGKNTERLVKDGYKIKNIEIARNIDLKSNIRSLVQMVKYLRSEKFDIVHVHTPIAALLGRIAAKMARVPVVIYTAHGFYFHERMGRLSYRFFVNLEKIAGRFLTDYIFTQSEEDRVTALKERITAPGRICTIGNGVDTDGIFNPRKADPEVIRKKRQELNIDEHDRVVMFIGRLVREKGIVELLEAFNGMNIGSCKLLLVGDLFTAERDVTTYEYIKKAADGNKNIIMTGRRTDINDLLYMSDVFVLPSHREGMPRSVIEAMAMGKPVVATDIRGCREEVVEGETGFLAEVNNPEQLRKKITAILENPDLGSRMGRNARLRAEQLFDENRVLDRQVEVIRRLIGEKLQSG